jgi:hypothetical protein
MIIETTSTILKEVEELAKRGTEHLKLELELLR